MLKPFGVKLKLYSGYPIDPEYLAQNNAVQASLDEIFPTCKIVSIHSALSEQILGMIGKEPFDLLQDGAVFINTARGAIIRENEMIEALQTNRFMAVPEVYSKEPPEVDSPLRQLKNVLRFAEGKPLQYEITGDYAKRMVKQR